LKRKPSRASLKSLAKLASSTKEAIISDEGVSVKSDYSYMTTPEAVTDKKFWHIFLMITFSISYGYFTKVTFKSYGSLHINDDVFLTRVALYGYICAAASRFIWPMV
jgi:hypothetical protein